MSLGLAVSALPHDSFGIAFFSIFSVLAGAFFDLHIYFKILISHILSVGTCNLKLEKKYSEDYFFSVNLARLKGWVKCGNPHFVLPFNSDILNDFLQF